MKPRPEFVRQDKSFWACVRSLSQEIGYTKRGSNEIREPTIKEMRIAFRKLNLNAAALGDERDRPTELGTSLQRYFKYRAQILNDHVRLKLMDVDRAKAIFDRLRVEYEPTCPLPMNKQKEEKYDYAFLTCIINMTIEHYSNRARCDYDPKKLTTITRNGVPLRTLARRVDGAFPSSINPVAVWEAKEYYYTTTFGSRVAGAVYESLLDGLELEELRESSEVDIKHYLFVDAYRTWWDDGKSYLCRMIDILHMGYVDEILFGEEVVDELPRIVDEWLRLAGRNAPRGDADPAAPA